MYSGKKICGMVLAAAMLTEAMMIPAFAKDKKISSVNVQVNANIELESKYGDEDIEVETRGKGYTYDYYEIENFGFEWMGTIFP